MSDDDRGQRFMAALWADDRFRAAIIAGDEDAVAAEYQRLLDDDPDVQAGMCDDEPQS